MWSHVLLSTCLDLPKVQLPAAFKLRKNKWLSPGQPGYNFWLSVQVFDCPYLKQGKQQWLARVEFHSWGMEIYGCPSDNHISIFGCPVTFLVVPGARTTKISNAGYRYPQSHLFPNSNSIKVDWSDLVPNWSKCNQQS